ncbi:hypothetical protein V2G26_015911 [Clonostachys chloroleuca]|uniref:Uncharacterized protein n=3 Tax=Clonostachys TaxID=110564 RepID=A0A0B7KB87_BIOOC|nr:unnamed protein product [Clonostachys rosea f. rosea IK726]CAI6097105.1 unnamed protein product [Clonostachys chloroleuca]
MASGAVIPRFLLPLQGPLWRGIRIPVTQNVLVRFASSKSPNNGKPIVLEKPLKFNPPSHGSRLRKNTLPKHYGHVLSAEEVAVQNRKSYPGMMAPEGTWAHWFWHSRILHFFISMGTLLSLGIFTFFMNYASNSPFKELLPPASSFWSHPIEFFLGWKNVIVMHERDKAIRAFEHRMEHQNDVAKRRYYMKMHGIETKDPITMIFGKSEKEQTDEEIEAEALGTAVPQAEDAKPPERRKFWGIF